VIYADTIPVTSDRAWRIVGYAIFAMSVGVLGALVFALFSLDVGLYASLSVILFVLATVLALLPRWARPK
jgi:hypothetical protein